jgi:hydroxymethylpyrimidine pyrophosphatase-like HAD family hydrolase
LIITRKGEARKIKALRWQLGKQLDGAGRLVQAMIPDMLEVLPPNASKGAALKTLLKELGVAPQNVLAMGDGENDIEMLQLAGIGVAVGNADQRLKDIADHVVGTNDEDAVAQVIERFVLKQPLPQAATSTTSASSDEQVEEQ